jgi:hypothetical protein
MAERQKRIEAAYRDRYAGFRDALAPVAATLRMTSCRRHSPARCARPPNFGRTNSRAVDLEDRVRWRFVATLHGFANSETTVLLGPAHVREMPERATAGGRDEG